MESNFDSTRPMIPPKPDKDKINLLTTHSSPSISISPGSDPRRKISSAEIATAIFTDDNRTQNGESDAALIISPQSLSHHKPALPPKPSASSTPSLLSPRSPSHASSQATPHPHPDTRSQPHLPRSAGDTQRPSKISPLPYNLPKGRDSYSISNAILANRNSTIGGGSPAKTILVTQTSGNISSHRNCNNKNSCAESRSLQSRPGPPITSAIETATATATSSPSPSHPTSTIFTFPSPHLSPPPPHPASLKTKTASLGRNVAPPLKSPTSPKAFSQFISSKAASAFARMLPLDLNFGNGSQSKVLGKGRQSINFPIDSHTTTTNATSQRNTMFAFSGAIPPPPPPRLKKKLSPVVSSPSSPHLSPSSPQEHQDGEEGGMGVIYAEIDKGKKWEERRLREKEAAEVCKGSLVIRIDREQEVRVEFDSTVASTGPGVGEKEEEPSQKIENEPIIVVNSWLGNHFANHLLPTAEEGGGAEDNNQVLPSPPTVLREAPAPAPKEDSNVLNVNEFAAKELAAVAEPEPALLENKSFLFSCISTLDMDSPDKHCNGRPANDNENEIHPDNNEGQERQSCDCDSIIKSVDSKIQCAVNYLEDLSGKSSLANNHEEAPAAAPTPVEFLVINETPEDPPENLLHENGREAELINHATILSSQSSIIRRRSWNYPGENGNKSSSPCDSSSSSSLTNLAREKNRPTDLVWVDEGESPGGLGDVDTSDAPLPNSSSAEDVQQFSSRRKKLSTFFSSFGKSGSSARSGSGSNSNSNSTSSSGTQKKRWNRNGKRGEIISRPIISGPTLNTPIEDPPTTVIKDKSHSVQFSTPCTTTTQQQQQQHPHRHSTGSIGEGGVYTTLSLTLSPDSERGGDDDESICSYSSVSTTGTSTLTNVSAYEDIIAELSPLERKSFYVAREILTSEQTFIDVLNLLTEDFPKAIELTEKTLNQKIIPKDELKDILGNLPIRKSINEELEKDLQDRVSNWKENPKLADVFVKKGPFLKMYSGYIQDFEKITKKLDDACRKYGAFGKAVKEFEMSDRCKKLGLKHYMLKPVQRMPQYSLLLEDYLKHLDRSGCDYEDTEKALAIVKDVAVHANEALRLQMNAEKLYQLQNRISGAEIMKANRQLLKEGELVKVCRKDLQPRYFALMNDVLLCSAFNSTTGSTKDLKLRHSLSLAGMTLSLSEDYPNEFSVISTTRSFNLIAKSPKERGDWMKAISDAINDNIKKRTLNNETAGGTAEGFQLGKVAPIWVADERVTMCQICTAEFKLTFRRHHCRACGKVVCGNCSGNEAPLFYKKNDANRVCNECYEYLLEEFDKESRECSYEELETSRETIRNRFSKNTPNITKNAGKLKKQKPARLEVHANHAGSRINGYLHFKERRAWKRQWFVLMDRVKILNFFKQIMQR